MIPVVELLRVSTQAQAGADRAGLPAQHSVNLRTCEAFGLEVVASVEIVESGASVAESPDMQRVLGFIRSGGARGIVLAEYSRLFRPDRWSDFAVLQTLTDHDARIYLPSGPIDLQSEIGFVQATVNNLLAGMERRRIRERMERGKEEHRRRGNHVAGGIGIPIGLAWSKEAGWSYTPDIEIVREAFRLFLAGERNFRALGDAVGLARSSVRFVLQNPVYAGWRVYDKRRDLSPAGKYPGGSRRKTERTQGEIIRVRLPLVPIVSEQDFAAVQAIIDDLTARRTPRSTRADDFLYRGFVRCAHDGLTLYANTGNQANGQPAYNYVCPSRIKTRRPEGVSPCATGYMRREMFHEVLDSVIAEQLTDPDLLLDALSAYTESRADHWRTARADLTAVEMQIEGLDARRNRVLELYVEGLIDRAERDRRVAAIANERASLERILGAAPDPMPDSVTAELVGTVVAAFAEWRFIESGARRRVLEALSPVFWVDRYTVQGVELPAPQSARGQPLSSGWRRRDRLWVPLGAA